MPEEIAAPAPVRAKSKKKKWLFVIALLVLVLAIAGAGVLWLVAKQRSASLDEGDAEQAAEVAETRAPPAFLPMDNMVVNLADPGGDRFVQVGITLELTDAKVSEKVKAYMPSIRNGVLLLLSQRTTGELLRREGKEKLAADIRVEVLGALGYAAPRAAASEPGGESSGQPRRLPDDSPVRAVLFSSFIVQ